MKRIDRECQDNFTQNPVARRHMYDRTEREWKADKIIAVLSDFLGDLSGASILDLSCSTGSMVASLAGCARTVVGIDIDQEAVSFAKSTHAVDNLHYCLMDALQTAFAADAFDAAICNQMYEHVPDPTQLMAEILRVLKPGGVCYFGATNRLKVIETHYGRLPFLSYLPKPAADAYLRLTGRAQHYYETLYTYWGLRELVRDFDCIDYTEAIVRDPAKFHATDLVRPGGTQQRLALFALRSLYWACPGYVWLLQKPRTPVSV